MSYGIIRIQKFKAQDIRGIQSHDNRERKSHSNPDIDPTKSELNFSLVGCQNQNFSDAIMKNLKDLNSTKAVRKDAVVMVQCLVTSDHDFFKNKIPEPDKQRKFFEQSLAFIADRYGQSNIISATVHLDEKTPHMHVNLTPIRDRKLSAKSIFDRKELRSLHTDFHRSVGKTWGLERGESREEKRRHLDTESFKLESKKAELERAAMTLKPEKTRTIEAADLAPRLVGSRMLGLIAKTETPEDVATRLNADFVVPLQEKLAQVSIMRRKVEKLEDAQKAAEPELKRLQVFRKVFRDGLTKEQGQALMDQANGFRTQNALDAEKERREAEEREKQAQLEAELQQQAEKERLRVSREFERLLRNTPGTVGQHMEQNKELMARWDKAQDKAAFEKTVQDQFQGQQKVRSPRMR